MRSLCLFMLNLRLSYDSVFFFHAPPTTEFYTLSLHDALPILILLRPGKGFVHRHADLLLYLRDQVTPGIADLGIERSEEHTSELQSRLHLVCRLLLEKKKDASADLAARDRVRSDHAAERPHLL